MKRDDLLYWVLGGAVLAWILYSRPSVGSAARGAFQSAEEFVNTTLTGWQTVHEGPTWVPVLNATEDALGIPQNLLARQAYQESRFRPEIINGTLPSPAGALGILQLMPQFFQSVRVPIPFGASDVTAQISEAGYEMVRLFNHYQDWGLALAAYNDGQGNLDKYLAGVRQLPATTLDYVRQITADVPVSTAIV